MTGENKTAPSGIGSVAVAKRARRRRTQDPQAEPQPSSAEVLKKLKEQTLAHCARCYRQLRGHPWPVEVARETREWLECNNRDERDAYAAFVVLQKGLAAVGTYYRKHPALRVSSHHGSLLHMIRGHIEPLLGLPWATEKARAFTWETRLQAVSIYDREYPAKTLHVRSPGATSATRLTVTELAWHSILHGNWPGLDVTSTVYGREDVVAIEAKHIGDAQRRLKKFLRWAEARSKK